VVKESSVEDYFIERVKATGGEVRKVKWSGRIGAPDRLAGWPSGRYAFVELKSDDQRWGMQPSQIRELDKMRSWGITVWPVIGSRSGVDIFIKQMTGVAK